MKVHCKVKCRRCGVQNDYIEGIGHAEVFWDEAKLISYRKDHPVVHECIYCKVETVQDFTMFKTSNEENEET